MRYLTKWQKRSNLINSKEELMLLKSKFQPNEKILYRGHKVKLMYAEVRDNTLGYFAKSLRKGIFFFLPESSIPSDQI